MIVDNDPIDKVLDNPNVNNSMFLTWIEAYKVCSEATNLRHYEFPSMFIWIINNIDELLEKKHL